MEWVHCSCCFVLPLKGSGRSFFLTSCSHLLCGSCKGRAQEGVCPACKLQCSTIRLVPNLSPTLSPYFTDPAVLLRKAADGLEFQRKQRMKTAEAHKRSNLMYQYLHLRRRYGIKQLPALRAYHQRLEEEAQALMSRGCQRGVAFSVQSSPMDTDPPTRLPPSVSHRKVLLPPPPQVPPMPAKLVPSSPSPRVPVSRQLTQQAPPTKQIAPSSSLRRTPLSGGQGSAIRHPTPSPLLLSQQRPVTLSSLPRPGGVPTAQQWMGGVPTSQQRPGRTLMSPFRSWQKPGAILSATQTT